MVLKCWFRFLLNRSKYALHILPYLKTYHLSVSSALYASVLLMAHSKKLQKGLSFSLQELKLELDRFTSNDEFEAHNMVREANEKQAAAEKALATAERSLKESQMKVDVLTAEVSALKTLVLTSTPSSPNPHLHPQIGNGKDDAEPLHNKLNCFVKHLKFFLHNIQLPSRKANDTTARRDIGKHSVVMFSKKHHRRSPSHFNLKYGRENSPPDSPVKEVVHITSEIESKDGLEVDPVIHKEFLVWRQKPVFEKNDPFIQRIYKEDIDLCLRFNNNELTDRVICAVESGTIRIEAIGDKGKAMFPKKCALLEVSRLCFYRMNIGENDDWYNISQICRNRIIAVCDFLNYLRYIEAGLVKSSAHDVYWEVVRLRKNMCFARLGLVLS